jgi:hypothetical protein
MTQEAQCMQINVNRAKKVFGFTDEDSVGKVAFPAVQAAPCFSEIFPHMFGKEKRIGCLIPCAIDQVCHSLISLIDLLVSGFQQNTASYPNICICKFKDL